MFGWTHFEYVGAGLDFLIGIGLGHVVLLTQFATDGRKIRHSAVPMETRVAPQRG
jgi:hypothetical protein